MNFASIQDRIDSRAEYLAYRSIRLASDGRTSFCWQLETQDGREHLEPVPIGVCESHIISNSACDGLGRLEWNTILMQAG